jgi:hypothetical protein
MMRRLDDEVINIPLQIFEGVPEGRGSLYKDNKLKINIL